MPEGIDIYSRYQTVTDWRAVRAADVTWCYQKVSDGSGTRNPQTVAAGRAAGVLQGGYHFSQVGSPVDQANLLVNRCEAFGLVDLNPCLDMEDNPPDSGVPNIPTNQKADFVIAFGRQVLRRGHGFTLYANNFDWGLFGAKVMAALPQTFRWVARYGANPTVGWDAHQYTSSGSCPGVRSNGLDRNRGKIPVNRRGEQEVELSDKIRTWAGEDLPLDRVFAGTLGRLVDMHPWAQQIPGLVNSIQKLTNLVIADSANDVTEETFKEALRGFFTSEVGPALREALAEIDFKVEVDPENIATATINKLYGRLEQ